MIEEKLVPDPLSLLLLRRGPEFFIRHVHPPERLADEVVVDEQLINSPQQQIAKRRVVEMRVDVEDGCLFDDIGDSGAKGSCVHRRTLSHRAVPGQMREWRGFLVAGFALRFPSAARAAASMPFRAQSQSMGELSSASDGTVKYDITVRLPPLAS